jgi:hypothetical protein
MTDIVTHNDRIATIGMGLGKRNFHLIGMDARTRATPGAAARATPAPCSGALIIGHIQKCCFSGEAGS